MDAETRQGLLHLFDLSEADVNSIEDDPEVHAALKGLVQQATAQTYQRLLKSAAAERQVPETAAEARRLEQIVEVAGFSYHELSGNTRAALDLLSSAADALQLHDPSPSSLISAAIHLSLQGMQQRLQQLQQAAAVARTGTQHAAGQAAAAAEALQQVEEELSRREAQVQGERDQGAGFVTKTRQYEAEVAKFERTFQVVRADPQLMHDKLEALGKEVEAMQAEAQQTQAQLAAYHGLPPSLLGAQLELRNLRDQLSSTRLQLEQSLAHL